MYVINDKFFFKYLIVSFFSWILSAEMKIVVCDTEEKVKLLLKQKDQTPLLKHIIVVKEVSEEVKQAAKNKGVELSYFKDIVVSSV